MRVVFLGTPASAATGLEALLDAGHEVPLVVTRPDRPVGRDGTPRPPAVKELALSRGLQVLQPEAAHDPALFESVLAARPDVLVVIAYGRILPKALLDVAPLGAVNVHFSLLPAYRGAAPVQWALALGERATGVTTMRVEEALDEGGILLQRLVPIEPGEHAPALLRRLAVVGAALLVETLEGIARGTLRPTPQDPSKASRAPRLRREDGEADFRRSAREVEGRVRGFDPWPGVWARRQGRRLRLVEAEGLEAGPVRAEPGRVVAFNDGALQVACGGGTVLALRAVQPEGRRAMSALDAVNGRQLLPGDLLEGKGA